MALRVVLLVALQDRCSILSRPQRSAPHTCIVLFDFKCYAWQQAPMCSAVQSEHVCDLGQGEGQNEMPRVQQLTYNTHSKCITSVDGLS